MATSTRELAKRIGYIEERLLALEHIADLEEKKEEIISNIVDKVLDEIVKRMNSPEATTSKRVGLV